MNEDSNYDDQGSGTLELDHVGVKAERTYFSSGDLERAFAYAWMEKNERDPSFLHLVLQDQGETEAATQRDARVAATIIQWLGCNMGFHFMINVLRQAGYTVYENPKPLKQS